MHRLSKGMWGKPHKSPWPRIFIRFFKLCLSWFSYWFILAIYPKIARVFLVCVSKSFKSTFLSSFFFQLWSNIANMSYIHIYKYYWLFFWLFLIIFFSIFSDFFWFFLIFSKKFFRHFNFFLHFFQHFFTIQSFFNTIFTRALDLHLSLVLLWLT